MSTKDTNKGNDNCGNYNIGNDNHGDHNRGDHNIGSDNKGNDNCGNYNIGSDNHGDHNRGDHNIGNYNRTSNAWGCFNTVECDREVFHMFNKATTQSRSFWIDDIKADWSTMSDKDKLYCLTLENFDAKIFEECTGVKLTNEDYMMLL